LLPRDNLFIITRHREETALALAMGFHGNLFIINRHCEEITLA
jgi:hypothetical protein